MRCACTVAPRGAIRCAKIARMTRTLTTSFFIVTLAGLPCQRSAAAQSWQKTSAPEKPWLTIASSTDGRELFTAPAPGNIYSSQDSGNTWTASTAPSQYWISLVRSSDGSKVYAAVGGSDPTGRQRRQDMDANLGAGEQLVDFSLFCGRNQSRRGRLWLSHLYFR
jgi:photosystem II stability/assembly factor-like uncharacterized protein